MVEQIIFFLEGYLLKSRRIQNAETVFLADLGTITSSKCETYAYVVLPVIIIYHGDRKVGKYICPASLEASE